MHRLIILIILTLSIAECIAHPGVGVVMYSHGNLYYTDLSHVWKISPTGQRSIAVRNVHTHELYLDEQENLYGEHEWYYGEATDKWGNYVWRLNKGGDLERYIPAVEGFMDNTTLVRDIEGNSYWASKIDGYSILNIDSRDGKTSRFTDHPFKDIRWLYYSKSDHILYVVDYLQIKKVSATGKVSVVTDILKESGPSFEKVADRHYVFGLWTDHRNDLYIAVYGAQKVIKIDSKSKITTVFESEEGWSPCGGMSAADGSLWIMEFSKNNKTRIRKIDTHGGQTVYGG